jgi:hypothetical protein
VSKTDDKKLQQRYERETGHPPNNLPPDDPDLWQWLYGLRRQGSIAEQRALMLERMGLAEEEEGPVIIEGQEEMF